MCNIHNISNPVKLKSPKQKSKVLTQVAIFQILSEDDPTPPDCATNIVNKDLAVYLQLQGALNTEAEHEKLRKKREEVQK